MNFPDEFYNVYVMDYDPQFMKLFYNSININQIHQMEINFDFHSSSIESLSNIPNDNYKTIFIRYKSSAEHYDESDLIVLQIEDHI